MLSSQGLRASAGNNTILLGSTSNNNASLSTINLSVPSGAGKGDLLFVVLSGDSTTETWTGPAGWSERLDANGRAVYSLASYDGTTASYTFTRSASGAKGGIMVCVRNATWRVIGSNSATANNPVAPAITFTTSNNMRFAAAYSTTAGLVWSTPSGFTEITAISTNTSIKVVVDNTLRGAVTTGTVTFTRTSGADTARAVQFGVN